MNDVISSPTAPANPSNDMLWMDTSKSPYKIKVYKNGGWQDTGYTSLKELDPEANDKVEDAYNGIIDLGSGNKLTRFERSVVRGELAKIVGKYLNAADAMPTIAQIDSGGVGEAFSIRKTARDIGVPTGGTEYVNFTNAYNNLRTYLSGMSPKAWDISSTGVNTIVPATWESNWNTYYLRYHLLNVAIQQRQHDYVDIVGDASVTDAIAAVSNSDQFELVPIKSPININAPFTSAGLPEFKGRHTDSWEENGRNLILNSTFNDGLDKWTGVSTSIFKVIEPESDKPNSYILTGKRSGATAIGIANAYSNRFNVTVGKTYTFTVDFKVADWTAFSDASYVFIIEFFNASGSRVQYRDVSTGAMNASPMTSGQWERLSFSMAATDPNIVTGGIRLALFKNGEVFYREVKVEESTSFKTYSVAPEEVWGTTGDRIKPITNPIFSAAGTLSLYTGFYGDGTNNDEFQFDKLGRAIKIKRWENVLLDGSLTWELSFDFTGSKRVRAVVAAPDAAGGSACTGVKYDGTILGTQADAANVEGNQVAVRSSDYNIFVGVPDADSGWGDTYTPTGAEIAAYFWGWRMCNGTFGQPYTGTGNKAWYPIGDTNMDRSTVADDAFNPVPTEVSPSITDQTIYPYQVLYRLASPVQEVVEYDGILSLVKGANEVTISYPANTPEITTGNIRYALNLATLTEYLKYIIPTSMQRIKNAEEKITDDAIVNTVTNSVQYTLAMTQKASIEDLGNYATNGQLDDLAQSTDGKIGNAIDSIDFSPYVTQSMLDQTATNITAKFSATGGMNLIHNSIGFAGLDFWGTYSTGIVQTMSNNELDVMGFGSGFQFNADGLHKGITQDVGVNPGQPYTLSWYLNKRTSGDANRRFWVQIQENGVTTYQIADNSGVITNGYEASHFTFIPQSEVITVRFIGYASVDATLTGIMLTIGDVPLQWSLSTGELYNTNIRMDVNGIRVSQFDDDRREIGYTQITPKEFAGYNDSEGNGVFKKIFYLNGDETVTTKLRATEEITMGDIKIIKVDTATRKGWAFVPNEDG
jgi:hypothetical protein